MNFITNSAHVNRELEDVKGSEDYGKHWRRAIRSEGGKNRRVQIYTEKLAAAICRGVEREIREDKDEPVLIGEVRWDSNMTVKQQVENAKKSERELHGEHEEEVAYDDVNGKELDPKLVRMAGVTDFEYFRYFRTNDKKCNR